MAKVGKADTEPEQQLLSAVAAHSWALDGHGRDNTITIDAIGGIAKIGAEGLVVIATPEGVAVAVKILDGSMRATTPVALAALAAVGAITSAVAEGLTARVSAAVLGGNKVIGGLRTTL
jgi:L-asparaginase II